MTTEQGITKLINKGTSKLLESIMSPKIAKIINTNAGYAAAASAAAGMVPLLSGAALATATAGFIWKMYVEINNAIGLKFSENILKSVATGMATNLATYAIGSIAASSLLSFVPFAGQAVAAIINGSVSYAMILVSGSLYCKTLETLFKSGKDISKISESDLKSATQSVMDSSNLKSMMDEAKQQYKNNKS